MQSLSMEGVSRPQLQPKINFIDQLPKDVFGLIRDQLDLFQDVVPLSAVSRRWYEVCCRDPRWESVCKLVFGDVTSKFAVEDGDWRREFIKQRKGYDMLYNEKFQIRETSKIVGKCMTWTQFPLDMNLERIPACRHGSVFYSEGYIYGIACGNNCLTRWKVGKEVDLKGELLSGPGPDSWILNGVVKGRAFISYGHMLGVLRVDTGNARGYEGIFDVRDHIRHLLFSKDLILCATSKVLLVWDSNCKFLFKSKNISSSAAAVLGTTILIFNEEGVCKVTQESGQEPNVECIHPFQENERGNCLVSYVFGFYAILTDFNRGVESRAVQFNERGEVVKSFTIGIVDQQLHGYQIVDRTLFSYTIGRVWIIDFRKRSWRKLRETGFLGECPFNRYLPGILIKDHKIFGVNIDRKVAVLEPVSELQSWFSYLFGFWF